MFATTFSAKPGLSFFFPLGNLSLCNRKQERNSRYFPKWESLGETA